mmetsp:Transcript_71830/g.208119  ORF Transcript_71830/g.208119 Transcript_71830/m.208119 type:complete len:301 (-) Transcript_71830:389-1291(-)
MLHPRAQVGVEALADDPLEPRGELALLHGLCRGRRRRGLRGLPEHVRVLQARAHRSSVVDRPGRLRGRNGRIVDRKLPCQLVLVVDGLPQHADHQLRVHRVVRDAQDLHEVLPGDMAEVLAETARHTPHLGEGRGVLLLVLVQRPVEPRKSPLSRLEARGLLAGLKDVLVLLEHSQAELRDDLPPHARAQGVDAARGRRAPVVWQVGIRRSAEHGGVIIEELLLEAVDDGGLLLEEVGDAIHVAQLPEVARELLHGMDEPRSVLVLPPAAQCPQLLQRSHEHHQALQRRNGKRQIALCDV